MCPHRFCDALLAYLNGQERVMSKESADDSEVELRNIVVRGPIRLEGTTSYDIS
jgi:hypothetical protein